MLEEKELLCKEQNKNNDAIVVLNKEMSLKDDFISKLQKELEEALGNNDSNRLQMIELNKTEEELVKSLDHLKRQHNDYVNKMNEELNHVKRMYEKQTQDHIQAVEEKVKICLSVF